MSIISGYQKIKKMIKTSNGYQLLSHWTSSDTVEMKDGSTLEDRICNVDNTADQDKPISTAQQNALNQKANIDSPILTGTPTAPTPSSGTSNTQIATTAFVQTAISNEAITDITSGDAYIDCSQSGSAITISHKNVTRTNTTSTVSPTSDGTITAVNLLPAIQKDM